MNGDTLDAPAPRFIVGTWDRLKEQQRRLFVTYAEANFGEAAPDPAGFARGLWNDSVAVANTGAAPGSDRLLNLSRLTTFLGVTGMWEKCGVAGRVKVVTNINGDQQNHNFRLYGELEDGGGQAVKDAFRYNFAGSGHGEYSVSRRERNFWREPNGQFSLTPDLRRFDSDVDYRSLIDAGHNTKENSDIRAFDGGSSHLARHASRYGEVAITMLDADGLLSDSLLVSAHDAAPAAEAVAAARAVADRFAERFAADLTLGAGLYEEMFAADAILHIRAAGFFAAAGLEEGLADSLGPAELVRVYQRVMDFYYLRQLFTLRTEFLGALALGERTQPPAEAEAALRSVPKLGPLADESAADSEVGEDAAIETRAELEEYLAGLARSAEEYRARLREHAGRPEIFRANLRGINAQKDNPLRVESGAAGEAAGAARDIYTAERGIFIVQSVGEAQGMKIINLGVGN